MQKLWLVVCITNFGLSQFHFSQKFRMRMVTHLK
jgi:hypothetical protein